MSPRLALLALLAGPAFAQTPCAVSPPNLVPKGVTIFSPEQEGFLGDVVAQQMEQRLKVYHQPELLEPIQRIAGRLLRYMPPNQYDFRFSLIEIPEANAFVLPGGRIYISRRLIAFVQNEDELAGVIAHETGHVLARQASVNMTRVFRDILKVNSVGDRADIVAKFNQVLDNVTRKAGTVGRPVDDEVVADRVSVEAAWRAGYEAEALPRLLDRLAETKGATGNVFSDLFGLTRPESKRLREMLKALESIPASCRQALPNTAEQFRVWQKTVEELRPEDLTPSRSPLKPALMLRPKLRPEITNIRFSPDGQYLLAQDESGINLLQRDPFQYLFRIPALEARAAAFQKDSARVAFVSGGSRIEIWNIESRSRERLWAPNEDRHCVDLLPSPDGRFAACFWGESGKDVRLLGLDTKTEIAHHGFTLDLVALVRGLFEGSSYRPVHGEFSPDGSSFLAASSDTESCCQPWAFNLDTGKEVSIGGPLSHELGSSYAFVGASQIAALNPRDPRNSGLFQWPQGKPIERFALPDWPLASVTKGPTVLLRPFQDYAVAAMSLEDKVLFQVSSNPALDRYEDLGAAERLTGEIALYPGRKTQPLTTLQLPEGDLGRLRSAAHSPDLTWLALSVRSRSAYWNLHTGQAQLSPPFDGGSISADGVWTATFEQRETKAPGGYEIAYARASFDLPRQNMLRTVKLPKNESGRHFQYSGPYEVAALSDQPKRGKYTFQVKDTVTDRVLWSRELDDLPGWHVGDALVLEYYGKDQTVDRLAKESPELRRRLAAAPKRDGVSVLEVLALDSGKLLGRVVYDRDASVFPKAVHVAGKNLFVEDSSNRTLAYSLETGERSGQQFGTVLATNPARSLVGVQNEPGRVSVYDSSMHPIAEFVFPGNIIYAGFDGSGKRLLAVTGGQDVFIENLP